MMALTVTAINVANQMIKPNKLIDRLGLYLLQAERFSARNASTG